MTRKEIWVYIERNNSGVEDVSLEILGKGTELSNISGYILVGLIAGTPEKKLIDLVIEHGADRVALLKNEMLNEYSTDYFVNAISEYIKNDPPEVMLIGATQNGRDLAGRLAGRLKTGLTANAITLSIDREGMLLAGVPAYGGKILAEIGCEYGRPQMSTVRPGTFKMKEVKNKKGEVDEFIPDLSAIRQRVRIVERNVSEVNDLTRSERTIIGGNGTRGDLTLLKELAQLMNAEIGVTRPLADRGVAPRELQVGSTGYSLKSKIALVLGVSGSEHFTSGIRDCEEVIAIDVDEKSEIFNHCDYCMVGDIFEVLPLTIKKMEETR